MSYTVNRKSSPQPRVTFTMSDTQSLPKESSRQHSPPQARDTNTHSSTNRRHSPQARDTSAHNSTSSQHSPQARGTKAHNIPKESSKKHSPQARGKYVASNIQNQPTESSRPHSPQTRGTHVASNVKNQPKEPSRQHSPQTRDTHVASNVQNQPNRTFIAPNRTFIAPNRTYIAPIPNIRNETHTVASEEDEDMYMGFDSYYLRSDSDDSRQISDSDYEPLTAGRLFSAPLDAAFYYADNDSYMDYEESGEETIYEDDVFEPDQPARFRETKVHPDFMKYFYTANAQKVHEYNTLWSGLVDLLEEHHPFTNAAGMTCPWTLIETVKQLIYERKFEFKMFKLESMLINMTTNLNFSRVQARIKRSQHHLSDLLHWMKEERQKAFQERLEFQDQMAQLETYLTYLEKKKQLLKDYNTNYPYQEALISEIQRERDYSNQLRQELIEESQKLFEVHELIHETVDSKASFVFEQQDQLCDIAECFEINALLDEAIRSVLGGGGEPIEEIDEDMLEEWKCTFSEAFSKRDDHLLSIIKSNETISTEVAEQEGILLTFKEETEELDFEVNIFSDNSILKNENIARLKDIIKKGRDPNINENANLYAIWDRDMSDQEFGKSLLDKKQLFSTPVRYADEPASPDLTFRDQQKTDISRHQRTPPQRSGEISIKAEPASPDLTFRDQQKTDVSRQQRTPSQRSGISSIKAESDVVDDAFSFLDQFSSSEASRQPLDLSQKQLKSTPIRSSGLEEAAMIDDAHAFQDQSSLRGMSGQPLNLSQKQLESIHLRSPGISRIDPGIADAAMIDDPSEFIDQLNLSEMSGQPLQSTFIQRSGKANITRPVYASSGEEENRSDLSSFAANPPQSVFYPRSETDFSKTKKPLQKSLIPRFDRSLMKTMEFATLPPQSFKTGYSGTGRSLYNISEHSPMSKTDKLPLKGKKKVLPTKRPAWNASTRVPAGVSKPKIPSSMLRSLQMKQMKSSPLHSHSRFSKTTPIKTPTRPKSSIPVPIPPKPYQLKSPPTPPRKFNLRKSGQMNEAFETSFDVPPDYWRYMSKRTQPQVSPPPIAVPQNDTTHYPTPPMWRRGNVPVPPYISTMPVISSTFPMNRKFRSITQMNRTIPAARQRNMTGEVRPQRNRAGENRPQIDEMGDVRPQNR